MSEETQDPKNDPSHNNFGLSNLNTQSLNVKTDIIAAFNQLRPMKLDLELNSEQEQEEQEALRKQIIQQTRLKFLAYQQQTNQQNMQDTAQLNPFDNINNKKPQEYHKHSSATGSSGLSTDFTSQPSYPSSFKKDFSLE